MNRIVTLVTLLAVLMGAVLVAAPGTAQAQDDGSPFPVTIEHKFGSTTINEAPERVVALGYTEQDFLLAVGVTPVAVRYWYGDEDDAIFPWADDLVEGEEPVVLNMPFGSLNYEAILALEPDLISAVTAGITQDEYDALSQIAPTIAQTDDYIDFGMPWQEVMQMIATAVGQSAEAAAIVADVEGLFAAARAEHPEFQGKTVAVSYFFEDTYGFYTDQDSRGRFFTELGFVMPDELLEVAGDSFYVDLSAERVDLLDQDLIAVLNLQFVEGGREALEAEPLFGQLGAVQEGRVVYLDEQSENALGFSSPLSLAYALDAVLPQLEAIFGGSPAEDATAAASCEEGFHLFDHEYLATDPVCIPDDPQRVIALDMAALELLLYTDIEVVGATEWILDEMAASLPPLADEFASITNLGYPVNTEMVLEVQPDLVLVYDGGDNVIDFDAVSQIAPVVMTSLAVEDWERTTEFWSEVLGVEDVFQQMQTTYDARIAALQAALSEDPAATEVSLVTAMSYGLVLWMSDSPQGKILADVGFARPETQQENPEGDYWLNISEETLDMADGDVAFLFAYPTTDPETAAEESQVVSDFQESPLWQSLDVTQSGEVYVMEGYWYRASTYLIANRIIDDLFASLTGAAPETTYLDLLPGADGASAA